MAGRPPKYPWVEWFDELERGSIVSVCEGIDFDHSPGHMRSQILLQARNRGVPLRTTWLPRQRRFDVQRKVRSEPYPWTSWLDGRPHQLLPDLHFRGKTAQEMAARARLAGARKGLKVRTTTRDGSLWLQAFPKDDG